VTADERGSAANEPDGGSISSRAWALGYARLGWRVFPLVPGEKRPLYKGWQRDATTDPDLVTRIWRDAGGPNIGVVCGEAFDAFDIEAAHLAAFRTRTEALGVNLPLTLLARTGRGGIHLLVTPTGIGRGRDLILDGVHIGELKSSGGFIVVCPSVTVARYRWLRAPAACPLAPASKWLLDLVARPRPLARPPAPASSDPQTIGRQLAALRDAVAGAVPGQRNKLLYWAMRRATEEGIAVADAARALAAAAADAGLAEPEVRATLRSAVGGARR
jgi:hypothetical protein